MKVPGDRALDDQLLYDDMRIVQGRPAPMKAASAPALPTSRRRIVLGPNAAAKWRTPFRDG